MAERRLKLILTEVIFACVGGALIFGLYVGVLAIITRVKLVNQTSELHIGATVPHLTVSNLSQKQRILLVATSATCAYSLGNKDFHRELISKASAAGLRVVVVVPNKASKIFALRELVSHSEDVIVTQLPSLGIMGTPSIAVLDPEYHVLHLWSGLLPVRVQSVVLAQVASSLHVLSEPDLSTVFIQGSDGTRNVSLPNSLPSSNKGKIVKTLTERDVASDLRDWHIVDIAPRDVFARAKKINAINIPADELQVRARYELNAQLPWIIDCSSVESGVCDVSGYELERMQFRSVLLLDRGAEGISCKTTPAP